MASRARPEEKVAGWGDSLGLEGNDEGDEGVAGIELEEVMDRLQSEWADDNDEDDEDDDLPFLTGAAPVWSAQERDRAAEAQRRKSTPATAYTCRDACTARRCCSVALLFCVLIAIVAFFRGTAMDLYNYLAPVPAVRVVECPWQPLVFANDATPHDRLDLSPAALLLPWPTVVRAANSSTVNVHVLDPDLRFTFQTVNELPLPQKSYSSLMVHNMERYCRLMTDQLTALNSLIPDDDSSASSSGAAETGGDHRRLRSVVDQATRLQGAAAPDLPGSASASASAGASAGATASAAGLADSLPNFRTMDPYGAAGAALRSRQAYLDAKIQGSSPPSRKLIDRFRRVGPGVGGGRVIRVTEVALELDTLSKPVGLGASDFLGRHKTYPYSGGTPLQFHSNDEYPRFPMDESYTLSASEGHKTPEGWWEGPVKIRSPTVWGLMRGLETFRQLVLPDGRISGAPLEIEDTPRFTWRGMMIDTSRHFLPVENILRVMDGMAASKLNTLHWHIVDAQSFPLLLTSHPELARKGAWGPDKIYTPKDVMKIVEYGRLRGIRVVPELDIPAHTASWGKGIPGMLAMCHATGKNWTDLHELDQYVLDPTKEITYTVLESVIKEVSGMFPDDYLHIGGDEVFPACWSEIPSIRKYMEEHDMTSVTDLQAMFVRRVKAILAKLRLGKTLVVWQGIYNQVSSEIPTSAAVEPWKCWGLEPGLTLENAAREHHGVLRAACWYLDYEDGWEQYYSHDVFPSSNFARQPNAPYIWGGEATLFAEHVDRTNVDCRMWPRGAVVAERLWSVFEETDWNADALYPRLYAHRQRLTRDGIEAAPLLPLVPARRRRAQSMEPIAPTPPLEAVPTGQAAQCFPLEQHIQRPAQPTSRVVIQWNIDNGGGSRLPALLDWLRSRMPDVVGLVEANDWVDDAMDQHKHQQPQVSTHQSPSLSRNAQRAGLAYAHVFRSTVSPYNLGLMASSPIEVLKETSEGFERGILVAKINGMVHIVVHLNAHDAVKRASEVNLILEEVHKYTRAGLPVMVMGDMNTLSPRDAEWHKQEKLLEFLQTTDVTRLKKKYLRDPFGNSTLDYRPMQKFLDGGLQDMCTAHSWPDDQVGEHDIPSPCLFTEPTKLSLVPESPEPELPFRLDYALGNAVLFAKHSDAQCVVVQTEATNQLSDHFPLECRWSV